MARLERIKNKYDFLFGEGNPETDSVADEDTSWLIQRCEQLTEALLRIPIHDDDLASEEIRTKALEGDE